MKNNKIVFYDTETTGLTPGQIGQLSCIYIDIETLEAHNRNFWFAVDNVDESVVKIFGRDVDFYRERSGGKLFKDYIDDIVEIFDGSIHVAFNIKFDSKFMSAECWRVMRSITPDSTIDPMELWKPIVKSTNMYGKIKYPKLGEVVEYLNLDDDKILGLSKRIFTGSSDDYSYHDSRFDTTCLYVISTIYNDMQNGKKLSDINFVKLFGRGT